MSEKPERKHERVGGEEPDWLRHLRAALDDTLLDVRVAHAEDEEGFDFLLVHRKGGRSAAIRRFSDALLQSNDIPPHLIIAADEERAQQPWYAGYKTVKR